MFKGKQGIETLSRVMSPQSFLNLPSCFASEPARTLQESTMIDEYMIIKRVKDCNTCQLFALCLALYRLVKVAEFHLYLVASPLGTSTLVFIVEL